MVFVIDMATSVVLCIYHTAINHLQAVEEKFGAFAKWDNQGLNLGLSTDRFEVVKQDKGLTEGRVRAIL